MRQSMLILIALVVLAGSARAQESGDRGLQGSVFLSVVRPTSGETKVLQLGGGLEVELPRGFGVAAELGHIYTDIEGTGLLSVNASYRYRALDWIEPSVTAGYSRAFQGSSANLFHFGVGATRWANDHAGIRLELRDYLSQDLWASRPLNTLEYRFSVVLR